MRAQLAIRTMVLALAASGCGGGGNNPALDVDASDDSSPDASVDSRIGDGGTDTSPGDAVTRDAPSDAAAEAADGGVVPTCNANGWCWVQPLPQGNDLHSVWGFGPDDVWAVGFGGLVHCNGSAWSSWSAPVTIGADIWGSSPNDVWVAD